ncbi:PLP-dependent aminotransferase family protein [Synergistaceae bacterium OttesenSCG-928-D05]|nr:PLP-dependent aminotransferase family protein [Synergistaceae bacterium OttesenSCG-928-D05]
MLLPTIGQTNEKTLYEQIYLHYRGQIETGEISAHEKLPSRRRLAQELRVSGTTIDAAYAQLLAEGYIYAKKKSGYYAAALDTPATVESRLIPAAAKDVMEREYPFELRTNLVDMEKFPFSTWAKLMRQSLTEDAEQLLTPMDSQGDIGLRIEILKYLEKYRGIKANAEQVVIGAGSEFLLSLLVQLLGREHGYAVEDPGYAKTAKILAANGASVYGIPMDREGMSLAALSKSSAKIAHVTPSHHFPLGIVTPVARRSALLQWAYAEGGRYIIEDDYDSEFRFSGRPVPAMQSMDRHGRVIYMNTFTKTLAPSMRISYAILPPDLLTLYQRKLSFYSCSVPKFDQFTLRRFLQGGYFDRHLNRMKSLYRSRRDLFIETLCAGAEGKICAGGQESGPHLVVTVNNGMDEGALVTAAKNKGVLVYGISEFYRNAQKALKSTVVLGYTGISEADLITAANLLSEAWFGGMRSARQS